MPGQHALLGPSSAARWLACPPSARLGEKLKERFGDRSTPFAEEGTAAHALAELKLRRENGEINDVVFKARKKDLINHSPHYPWAQMERSTDIYVDQVMTTYYEQKQLCPGTKLLIEVKLDIGKYVPGCFGTSDAIVVSDDLLSVFDYKNGRGVAVSAVQNPQARLYGLGAVELLGLLYGFETVRNVIVQPNLDAITEEVLSREDLISWGMSIQPTAKLAWRGEGEFAAGDHCRFCAARALCAHRAAHCLTAFTSGMETPGLLPDSEIPRILEVADAAESWIKDVRTYAETQALKGQQWTGFKLVRGKKPARKWVDEEEARKRLEAAGVDAYTHKMISPSAAEDLLGRDNYRALLGDQVAQGAGELTLVPESDKRPAINSTEAAFADLVEE